MRSSSLPSLCPEKTKFSFETIQSCNSEKGERISDIYAPSLRKSRESVDYFGLYLVAQSQFTLFSLWPNMDATILAWGLEYHLKDKVWQKARKEATVKTKTSRGELQWKTIISTNLASAILMQRLVKCMEFLRRPLQSDSVQGKFPLHSKKDWGSASWNKK